MRTPSSQADQNSECDDRDPYAGSCYKPARMLAHGASRSLPVIRTGMGDFAQCELVQSHWTKHPDETPEHVYGREDSHIGDVEMVRKQHNCSRLAHHACHAKKKNDNRG